MTQLLLIAHAATPLNAEGRYQGWIDPPLSEEGDDQILRLANALAGVPFDAVFSSDLGRAAITAGNVAEWLRGEEDARPPGGESLAEVAERIDSFRADLPGGSVAVVGHRGALRILICRLLGLPATSHWSFRLDIASITEFDFRTGRAVLTRFNDTHHLADREECHG
jgi:broad specificity phosphatase PhoE